MQNLSIWFGIFLINTNIFGLTKKGEYEYKYIRFDEKRANTNTNCIGLIKKGKYEYKYARAHNVVPGEPGPDPGERDSTGLVYSYPHPALLLSSFPPPVLLLSLLLLPLRHKKNVTIHEFQDFVKLDGVGLVDNRPSTD